MFSNRDNVFSQDHTQIQLVALRVRTLQYQSTYLELLLSISVATLSIHEYRVKRTKKLEDRVPYLQTGF